MVNKYYKKTRKNFKKKHEKGTKIFLKKKKIKRPETDIKVFLKKKKEKSVSIIVVKLKLFLIKKNKRKFSI